MPSASDSFPPTPESVGRARLFTRRTLASWGADGLEDDVRAVTSELATNALLHARTPFTLTLTLNGDRLRLTLADGSTIRPRMRRFDNAESTTGRGLRMVARLTQAWGVRNRGSGKAVWCDFRLPRAGERPVAGTLRDAADTAHRELDVETLLAMYGGDDDSPVDPQLFGRTCTRALQPIAVPA